MGLLTDSSARVSFTYDFSNVNQLNDWSPTTDATLSAAGAVLSVTGGTSVLRGATWRGLQSRDPADCLIQLETASASTSSAVGNTLGNIVYGHGDAWEGNPFNPNPGYMMTMTIFASDYEIDVNGAGSHGGTSWTPVINTIYDFQYTISPTALTIAVTGHGNMTVAGSYPLASSPQHVSFGPYNTDSVWDSIVLTGIIEW